MTYYVLNARRTILILLFSVMQLENESNVPVTFEVSVTRLTLVFSGEFVVGLHQNLLSHFGFSLFF